MKKCCFSGRRNLSSEQEELAVSKLKKEIEKLINEGYTHFTSGMAKGIDLIAAKIVIEQKKKNKHLILEAAVPYEGRLKSKDDEVLNEADSVYIAEQEYSPQCFFKRNQYMVDNSDLLIAVWDEIKSGGTYYTIKYAKQKNKIVTVLIV